MTENGKTWDIARPLALVAILIGLASSLLFHQDALTFALVLIFFAWMMTAMGIEDDRERAAWEERYAHMSDDAKIDHHLDRARRYGTNHDANIAQALIERKRK